MKTLSYEEIQKLTVQEACDYAVAKIVEQGKQCLAEGDMALCRYSHDGNHCAVGWLLGDIDTAVIEGSSVERLIDNQDKRLPTVVPSNKDVFSQLQSFHDMNDKEVRMEHLERLQVLGIDTDKPQWQQWVEMGE